MNDVEKTRYMDFLSIGVEQIESRNYDVGREFIDDVRTGLLNANKEEAAESLQSAIDAVDDTEYEEAIEIVQEVYGGLL